MDGILVPGGFGMRGIEGKIEAIRYARTRRIPYFGICLGMQCAVVEFARSVLGLRGRQQHRVRQDDRPPVIGLMEDQQSVRQRGGTMRLGAWPCVLAPDRLARQAYGVERISERHRHRYEFNNAYRKRFEEHGLVATGTSPDGTIVEIVELLDHPWFLAVQFHPEFKSKPTKAHPLFRDFVGAALRQRRGTIRGWCPSEMSYGATSDRTWRRPDAACSRCDRARHYETSQWVELEIEDEVDRRVRPDPRSRSTTASTRRLGSPRRSGTSRSMAAGDIRSRARS